SFTSSVINSNNDLPEIHLNILPSYFIYSGDKYTISESEIFYKNPGIAIADLHLSGNNQSLTIDGNYSAAIDDSLEITFRNLDMHMINDAKKDLILSIEGSASGEMTIKQDNLLPVFDSKIIAGEMKINDELIGDISILADWNSDGYSLHRTKQPGSTEPWHLQNQIRNTGCRR
ncbi:hypothetical protein ACFLT1_08075, partial [Bacteroidota bacterium]